VIQIEPTYAALWALISGLPGVNFATRRPVAPANLADGQYPALMMEQDDIEFVNQGDGGGTIATLPASIIGCVNTGSDPNVAPAIAANQLLDQVRAAIWPPIPGFKQTLGGLAESVYVNGKAEVFAGNQQQHGIFILPITIICADH
jgi:hypothetical protein